MAEFLCNTTDVLAQLTPFLPIVLYIFLIEMFFFSLVFVVATIISKNEWKQWIKTEASQLIISAILVFFIALLVSLSCSASNLLFEIVMNDPLIPSHLRSKNPFEIADSYLADLESKARHIYLRNVIDGWIIEGYSSISLQFGPPVWGFRITPLAGGQTVADTFFTIRAIFIPVIASVAMQRMLLSLIQHITFPILIPFGLILRIIPPFRKAGSFLIALGVCFYFVFTLTYVLNYAVYLDLKQSGAFPDPVSHSWTSTFFTTGIYSYTGLLLPAYSLLKAAFDSTVSFTETLALLSPQAFFLPALSTIITLAAVRSLTNVLSSSFG